MRLNIMVARARNGVIGRNGELPWHLSSDLRRFKEITLGHPILMGRRTHESIGRPLPGRNNLVVSRQRDYAPDGVQVVPSIGQGMMLAAALGAEELFIIGGAEVYAEALPQADRLYITEVHAEVEGDVLWPPHNEAEWKEVERDEREPAEGDEHPFTFRVLERLKPS